MKKRLRKKLFFSILPLLFLTFTLLEVETVHAGAIYTFAENTALMPFKLLLYGIFELMGLFVSIGITMFAYVLDPQHISGPNGLLNLQAVYDMWKFVRDIVNIFFILGLLYIAFSFVFQLDSHGNSKAIIKLIMAALLVNFSFPITRVIIDLANVPMYFFLQMILGDGNNAAVALSSSLSASHLDKILLPNADSVSGWIFDTTITDILVGIIFLFIFGVTILVFAFQFLCRIIGLVILLILSPIGFVANYIPGLKEKGFGKKWWDKFLDYALFGPAAIFMLVLATNFMAAVSGASSGNPYGSLSGLASSSTAEPSLIASIVLFFIPITMLWFAMGVSKNFSIAGADIATKYGQDFSKWAGKMVTTKPAKMIGRKVDSKLASGERTKYLSVGAWKTALKHRAEEQKHYDEQPIKLAAARMHDQLNTGMSVFTNTINPFNLKNRGKWGVGTNTDKSDHRFAQRQQQKQEYKKEISAVSERSDFVIHELKDAIAQGNAAKVEGAIDILLQNNDINDMIQSLTDAELKEIGFDKGFGQTKTVKDKDGNDIEQHVFSFTEEEIEVDVHDKNGNPVLNADGTAKKEKVTRQVLDTTAENYRNVLTGLYNKMGITDQEQAKSFMSISDKAQASGNFALGGLAGYNADNHKFEVNSLQDQARFAAAKFANMEPQAQARSLHPDSLFAKDNKGNIKGFNGQVAQSIIQEFSVPLGGQANRMRPDTLKGFKKMLSTSEGQEAFQKMYDSASLSDENRFALVAMAQQAGAIRGEPGKSIGKDGFPKTYAEMMKKYDLAEKATQSPGNDNDSVGVSGNDN